MKVLVLLLLVLLSTCCMSSTTNRVIDSSGQVSIPIPEATDSSFGWIILNQYEVVDFGYSYNGKEDDKNKTPASVEKFSPVLGYGAKFFLQEYHNVGKPQFYAEVAAMMAARSLSFYGADGKTPAYADPLANQPLTNISSNPQDVVDAYANSLQALVDNGRIGRDDKGKIWKLFFRADTLGSTNCLAGAAASGRAGAELFLPPEAKCANVELIRTHILEIQKRLAQRGTPPSIFQSSGPVVTTEFAARRDFSEATVQVGTLFVLHEQSISYSAHLSYYPFTQYSVYQDWANVLDRISLDVGLVGKPVNSANASAAFSNADTRVMAGLGYILGSNVSLQAGNVIWFEPAKTHNSFYFGITLDVLKIVAKLAK